MPRHLLHSVARVSSVALLVAQASCTRAKPRDDASTKPAEKRVKADSATVTERVVPKTVTLTGVLAGDQRTELAANASGRVLRTFVERGDHVKAGAILAQLDSRNAALTQTQANAAAASIAEQLAAVRADCARVEPLLASGSISKAEYDRTTSQCRSQTATEEAARARAAEAAQTLSDTSIRAPFAGVVAERFANVGDYVRQDSRIVTLVVDDPLRLLLTVPERAFGAVKEGSKVTFETVALPGKSFTGTVKFLGREVRATTRDVVSEAVVDNKERLLVPGMFVTARLPIGEMTLPVVPRTALVPTEPTQSLLVIEKGRIVQRVVQVGATVDDVVAIVEGIKKDERIVLHPNADTVDGALVE
jgi:membrane fusion protein (multidrug efflux system)